METEQSKYCSDYREALKLAIQREIEAENFYDRAAEKVHVSEPKSLLKRLAIEEKRHQALLNKFMNEVEKPPQGHFIAPSDRAYEIKEEDLKTTEQIFTFAIQKEEESLNFYARLLVYFFGTGTEKVFMEIFEMERDHKERLERNRESFFRK